MTALSLDSPEWLLVSEALKPAPNIHKIIDFSSRLAEKNVLLDICLKHGILLLVNDAMKGCHDKVFNATECEQWRAVTSSATLYSLSMHRELQRLQQLFIENKLTAMPFKGPALSAAIYGDPALRMSRDLDILVKRKSVIPVIELLIEEGYRLNFDFEKLRDLVNPGSHMHECVLQHSSCLWSVEIHWAVSAPWRSNPLPDSVLHELSMPEGGDGTEMLLYLCVHGARHWWWQLKWVVDVDRCVGSVDNVDWKEVFARARKRGCVRVVRLGLFLAKQVCGLTLPEDVSVIIDNDASVKKLAEKVTRYWTHPGNVQPSLFWKMCYLLECRERYADRLRMIAHYPLSRSVPFLRCSGADSH